MDKFNRKIFTESLKTNPEMYTEDSFSELILTINDEDAEEILAALASIPRTEEVAKHVVTLITIIFDMHKSKILRGGRF